MAPSTKAAALKNELRSIEQLIEDLLQQQTVLSSQLASLKPAGSQLPRVSTAMTAAVSGPGSSATWALVVKGRKRLSLPLSHSLFTAPPHGVDRVLPATRKRSLPASCISSHGSFSPVLDVGTCW
ncbi:hypothetical protein ABVT39_011482 [Epinephelus coioides]